MADREFKVDLENQKFVLQKDLMDYRSPWDTSFVPSNNKQQKEKAWRNCPSPHVNFLTLPSGPVLVFTELKVQTESSKRSPPTKRQ